MALFKDISVNNIMSMNDFLMLSNPPAIEFPCGSKNFTCFFDSNTLANQLKIPDIQRELDKEWVGKLKERIMEEKMVSGIIDLGTFNLCHFNNTLYLLNGQHRYSVMQELMKDNGNYIQMKCEVCEVVSESEMNRLWSISNDSRSSKICKNSNDQLFVNVLRNHLQTKYRDFMSNSDSPHRPNVNLNKIQNKIEELELISKLNVSTPDELINMVEEINLFYHSNKYNSELWESWGIKRSLIDKCCKKSPCSPLFLGVYSNAEWLDKLLHCKIHSIKYSEINHDVKCKKREKINQGLRRQVWDSWNSYEIVSSRAKNCGECYVCGCDLEFKNFECGHVVAHFFGGESILENLKPICASCNKSMGTQNLEAYKLSNDK